MQSTTKTELPPVVEHGSKLTPLILAFQKKRNSVKTSVVYLTNSRPARTTKQTTTMTETPELSKEEWDALEAGGNLRKQPLTWLQRLWRRLTI